MRPVAALLLAALLTAPLLPLAEATNNPTFRGAGGTGTMREGVVMAGTSDGMVGVKYFNNATEMEDVLLILKVCWDFDTRLVEDTCEYYYLQP